MKTCIRWMVSQWLYQSDFWSTLFLSAAAPQTHKFLMSSVSDTTIATKGIMMSVGIVIINSLFQTYGNKIYLWYKPYVIGEIAIYTIAVPLLMFNAISPTFYYLVIAMSDVVLARNIICCNNRLRRKIYDREVREKYDNLRPVVQSIAAITGNCIALCHIPLAIAFGLMLVGVVAGDVFLWIVYSKVEK